MAANVQALCSSLKSELLQGFHNFGTAPVRPTGATDTFKAALYFTNNGLGAATTAYSTSGECTGTGYTAGGIPVPNATAPALTGTTAYWTPSAQLSWTGLTISTAFDACLVYNSTQSNRAVGIIAFTAQTISSGTFNISMPANTSTSALLQFN